MIERNISEETDAVWINLQGRIDSMTSPDILQEFTRLIHQGHRVLVANLAEINYISSAGLRIFITAQKELKKVGGEVIIYQSAPQVYDVLKMSGFDTVFFLCADRSEIEQHLRKDEVSEDFVQKEIDGVALTVLEKPAVVPDSLRVIGSQAGLSHSKYEESDVKTVPANEIRFGTGLATLGDSYAEYKNYFGEALLLNQNFFYYPAVHRPAVDFMCCTAQQSNISYKFLHGFGFNGSYSHVISFESIDAPIQLESLVDILLQTSGAAMIGIVLLAESKGFWGMNLRKVPLRENSPANGGEIFDPENFTEWMNFPVEPTDNNAIIAGCGIAVSDKDRLSSEVNSLFSGKSRFHIHAGVFEETPLNKNVESFDHEVNRIITECDVCRIQHVQGKTKFSDGMVGIIRLA